MQYDTIRNALCWYIVYHLTYCDAIHPLKQTLAEETPRIFSAFNQSDYCECAHAAQPT